MRYETDFHGSKLALFIGNKLLVYLRDDKLDIPFPAQWDLPGGGRENGETPETCALRETFEEFGLWISEDALSWKRLFHGDNGAMWFFVAHQPDALKDQFKFGDEGQRWALWAPQAFLDHPDAIPRLKARLNTYLQESGYDR